MVKMVLVFGLITLLFGLNVVECQTIYDFIVVGAGSAGATLASRLSETPSFNVLLLEAGEKPPRNSEIPMLLGRFLANTEINWNYTMEPQEESCRGVTENKCVYSIGRCLGGSSQINNMLYVRGNEIDYNLWEADGAEGWAYKDVMPYFMKSEGLFTKNEIVEKPFHGMDGPLTVTTPSFTTDVLTAYINGSVEMGFPNNDYNGNIQLGFAASQANLRNGYRCSTEMAYLQPVYNRNNLKIITGAWVTKVDLEGTKAVGVSYIKDTGEGNRTFQVTARKEVILSAGAINTPQILMLSGIGPKQHLKDMTIDLVADLPVGQNLQDHVSNNGLVYSINEGTVPTHNEITNMTSQEKYDFPKVLTGLLSTPGLVEAIGLIKSPFEEIEGDYNDVQYFMLSTMHYQEVFTPEVKELYGKQFGKSIIQISPAILHPKSRGNVTLRSKIPTDPPIIRMNYLTATHDIKVMVYAMKKANEIVLNTKAFESLEPKLIGPFPGCENFTLSSDDYFECHARLLTVSLYHASCTCKMGRVNDPTTVVDSQLRVKGISSLRVVDGSVMPRIVSGNTNVPIIMIAEKAADMIKEQYAPKMSAK